MSIDENDRSITFGAYRDQCLRVAAALHSRYEVGEGTAVSWSLPTWIESLVLVGALGRLSARQNPIIPIYREREVGFATAQTGASLIIVPSVWRGFDYAAMAGSIAADRPGTSVLVCDRELPESDPDAASALPEPPPVPATAADAAGALGLLHVGHDRRPEGRPAHRPDGARLRARDERMLGRRAGRRLGPRLPLHAHRRYRLAAWRRSSPDAGS